jgi:hypothetical protein
MQRFYFVLVVALLLIGLESIGCAEKKGGPSPVEPIAVASTDWPWWRGPDRNGIAPNSQSPPVRWSEEENVLWKSPLPGRGHGSPTVVGKHVFLATADEQRQIQSVICFDRRTGAEIWKTDIHTGGFKSTGRQGNKKSSKASSTVACDGRRLFINFINHDAVYTTALSLDGTQLWQKKVTDYVMHQGYGSSPTVYGPLVIVAADNKGGGAITAFNRLTSDVVWTMKRPKLPNYTSPIILRIDDRDQLLFTGCSLVSSFEPLTGEVNWEIDGATEECVTSTVTDGQHIYSSGGYPKNHIAAVRADGSGEIVWEKKTRIYVPSMLVTGGHLYAVGDGGVAMCFESDTGIEAWKERLGGKFTASPVLVGEHIYATSESGRTFIFKAQPGGFEQVAQNDLGNEVYATPTICGSRVYMRVAFFDDDQRREMLYCLGGGK